MPERQLGYPITLIDADDRYKALFSVCRSYRYRWSYTWKTGRRILFVLLNPSKADQWEMDPTVTRCVQRGAHLGFHTVEIVNAFALISTDPKELPKASDPIGPYNNEQILLAAAQADMIICGWGRHAKLRGRGPAVLELLRGPRHDRKLHCLRQSKDGTPWHPLYLPYDLQPIELRQ